MDSVEKFVITICGIVLTLIVWGIGYKMGDYDIDQPETRTEIVCVTTGGVLPNPLTTVCTPIEVEGP